MAEIPEFRTVRGYQLDVLNKFFETSPDFIRKLEQFKKTLLSVGEWNKI